MKKLLIIVTLLSLISFAAHAETKKITVNGMVCAFCAQGLERSFGKLDAIDKTSVDLDNRLVTIKTKDGEQIDDETIKKIINDNGFDIVAIERSNS